MHEYIMIEKTVDQTLLDRRSVRRYERMDIAEDDLDFIRRAIQNTPTSYNGQQFSVIEISDQNIKTELSEIIGQKQIKTCNRLYCFLADYHKIAVAAEAAGIEMVPFNETVDGMIVGTVDATLAMMSALVAAESCGLGTCPIGYARTVAPAIINKILGLPDKTYLVCALAVGVPREEPEIKPKQPLSTVIFKDRYGDDKKIAEDLLQYDAEIHRYNLSRTPNPTDNDWIGHIVSYYREGMNYQMRQALGEQGFKLEK